MKAKLFLEVEEQLFKIEKIIQVGRGQDRNIRLSDRSVSNLHATIGNKGDVYALRDENSANGTYLNGQKITPKNKYLIRIGDILRFGNVTAKVVTNKNNIEISEELLLEYVESLGLGQRYTLTDMIKSEQNYRLLKGMDQSNNPVAIKVLNENLDKNDVAIDEFNRECRLVRRLKTMHHPNIVRIFYVEATSAMKNYYVMEYLDGKNLSLCVEEEIINPSQAIDITIKIAQALTVLYEKFQILHRSLHPKSILLTKDLEPKICNLGAIKGEHSISLTIAGSKKKSNLYLEPEVLLEQEHTIQSDIYSLGLTFYYMLRGKHAFGDIGELISFAASGAPGPKPLENLDFDRVVSKMIAYTRADRFVNYVEVIKELKQLKEKISNSKNIVMKQSQNFDQAELERRMPSIGSPNLLPPTPGVRKKSNTAQLPVMGQEVVEKTTAITSEIKPEALKAAQTAKFSLAEMESKKEESLAQSRKPEVDLTPIDPSDTLSESEHPLAPLVEKQGQSIKVLRETLKALNTVMEQMRLQVVDLENENTELRAFLKADEHSQEFIKRINQKQAIKDGQSRKYGSITSKLMKQQGEEDE